jgi:hypothetical protein
VEIETDKLPDSLLVGWRSTVVELTLDDPESDWDAMTVAVPLGVKVSSPLGIVSSVEAEIVAAGEAMLLTGVLGSPLQASRVLVHTIEEMIKMT